MEKLYDMFDKFVRSDWMTTALGVVIILGVTALLSRMAVSITRKLLKRGSLLPTSSIFVNVIRVSIWLVGISFMLSSCFNVDVSAIVTGLGVVGIAVSLGFQDTIANLIGGLQVSISRTVEPGDNIQLGASGVSGVVRDVTWRYTTIDNPSGTRIVIPNSLMNTTALLHLSAPENVSIPIVVTDSDQRLTSVAHHMEEAAAKALKRVDKLKKGPSTSFSEITAQGFKGSLSFTLTDTSKITAATDAAIRAIAPYAHVHPMEQMMGTIEQELLEHDGLSKDQAIATVYADRASTLVVPTADSDVAPQMKELEKRERATIAKDAGATPLVPTVPVAGGGEKSPSTPAK